MLAPISGLVKDLYITIAALDGKSFGKLRIPLRRDMCGNS